VTVTVGNPTLSISLSGSGATVGTALSGFAVATTGGKSPYACATSVASGALPAGVSIGASCTLTGTPTAAGTFTFTESVTDSSTGTGGFTQTSGTLSLVVAKGTPAIAFTGPGTTSLSASPITVSATGQSGDTGAVGFSSSTTGVCTVSGTSVTLLATGTCTLTANQAADTNWNAGSSGAQSFTVTPATLTLTPTASSATTVGVAYSQTNTASGGTTPYASYALASGTLPAGTTLNTSTGTVSGTPTTAGAFSYTIKVTDSASATATTTTISGTVAKGTPAIAFTGPGSTSLSASPITVSATGQSGDTGAVGFSSSTTGVCTVSGTAVTLLATGTCTLTANQAADANWNAGSSGAQSFTVTPATLTLTPTASSATTVGVAYSQANTASGGTTPYASYALASGTLPAGTTLNTATGTVSGTPTTAGAFAYAIKVTDGASAIATTTTISGTIAKDTPSIAVTVSTAAPMLGVPVTLTATLSGGVSPTGSVTFKDGATTLATATLSGGSASTTVSSLTLGAHSITAAYAGDANNLAVTSSATTVTVSSRPDPAADPTVRGIVTSQVTTATRFAQAQIDNTVRRLEEIHDEEDGTDDGSAGSGNGGSGNGGSATGTGGSASGGAPAGRTAAARGGNGTATADLGGRTSDGTLRMAASDPRPAIDADGTVLAFAPEDGRDRASMNDAGRAIQKITGAFAMMQKKADLPFRLWTAGSLDFGRLKIDGSYDNHFTTAGLTVGIDGRIMDGVKVGLALGYGQDRTTFGSDGSRSDGTAWTATLYGSWRFAPKAFLDVTGGYGTLRFDTRRWSTAGSVMLDGRRDGHEIFGSVGLTFAEKWGALKLSSYGRVDVVKVFLDAYGETGSAVWALAYDRLETTTVSGVAGLRANYTIPVEWGTVTPGVRLEYRHAFEGGFTQRLGYADLGGAGFAITGTPAVRDSLTGGVSLRMMTLDGISIDLEYLLTGNAEAVQNQQVRASVRVAF
jgi:uncharacterized protein with beta-barrel porin domain